MKYFKVISTKGGVKYEHTIMAETKTRAMDIIASKYKVKSIFAQDTNPPLLRHQIDKIIVFFSKLLEKKIDPEDLTVTFRQLSMMLNAGISIHQAISEISKFVKNEKLKSILQDVYASINSGKSLTDAFSPYTKDIGSLAVSMINLGEQTGSMSESLNNLADSIEESSENRSKFKKALRYPIFVIIAMIIAFTVLILGVVPKFKDIFDSLGANLPAPTIFLLNLEYVLRNFGALILGGIIAGIFFIKDRYSKSKSFQYKFDQYILKVKIIGNIIFQYTMNQYVSSLASLLKAGIQLENALNSTLSTIDNSFLKSKFAEIGNSIKQGANLTDAFKNIDLFDNTVIQMINAGELNGNIDEMLALSSKFYKKKYDDIIDNLQALIEPILTFFMAAMVLMLALGIFMPMWDLAAAAKS